MSTWVGKDRVSVPGVVNLTTTAVHANLVDNPKNATAATGWGQTRRLQAAFAAHLRHVGRVYPAAAHPRVVLPIDNAPWHPGEPVRAARADNPHLELEQLPADSPNGTRSSGSGGCSAGGPPTTGCSTRPTGGGIAARRV